MAGTASVEVTVALPSPTLALVEGMRDIAHLCQQAEEAGAVYVRITDISPIIGRTLTKIESLS